MPGKVKHSNKKTDGPKSTDVQPETRKQRVGEQYPDRQPSSHQLDIINKTKQNKTKQNKTKQNKTK